MKIEIEVNIDAEHLKALHAHRVANAHDNPDAEAEAIIRRHMINDAVARQASGILDQVSQKIAEQLTSDDD